jgi:CheY-like chemotaxis protein
MGNGSRVLVVDDDQALRSSAAEILRSAGYEVEEAEDGEVALQKLAGQPPAVVVLDIRMPRRDGISVLDSLQPPPPPPEVLLVSAYDLDRETRARLGEKVSRYMRKPVSPVSLLEAVSEAASREGRHSPEHPDVCG